MAPHPGTMKPRADLGAGLSFLNYCRKLLGNPLGDDVRDGAGRDDRRAIEVTQELDDDRVSAIQKTYCQHRCPLTVGVDDVICVAWKWNPDDRVVAVNDGSRRLSTGYPRESQRKSRDSRKSD